MFSLFEFYNLHMTSLVSFAQHQFRWDFNGAGCFSDDFNNAEKHRFLKMSVAPSTFQKWLDDIY